jgi:hypothetical protein
MKGSIGRGSYGTVKRIQQSYYYSWKEMRLIVLIICISAGNFPPNVSHKFNQSF